MQTSGYSFTKVIVYLSALMQLFTACPVCKESTVPKVKRVLGTFISVIQKCSSCHFSRLWESQPYTNNIPAGNLHLSTAILVSGSSPAKTLRLLEHLDCAVYSYRTFFRHQRTFLHPAISIIWEEQHRTVLDEVLTCGIPICLAGDARCDSPGHSAKYASYTFLNLSANKILDLQLIQVSIQFTAIWVYLHGNVL